MRIGFLAVCAFAISASAAAKDWAGTKPFIDSTSERPVAALSGCISKAWEARSGTTTYVATATGFTMRLQYDTFLQPLIAAQVEASDEGDHRRVIVYARKGDRSRKLHREIEGCL